VRPLLLGILLAAALSLGGGERAAGGNAARCSALTGDAARACYTKEVAASLGAPGDAPTTSFATAGFVCDLHARAGAWQ
jgi:hypothetical protein